MLSDIRRLVMAKQLRWPAFDNLMEFVRLLAKAIIHVIRLLFQKLFMAGKMQADRTDGG